LNARPIARLDRTVLRGTTTATTLVRPNHEFILGGLERLVNLVLAGIPKSEKEKIDMGKLEARLRADLSPAVRD